MCPTRAQLLGPAGADNAVQGQADAFEKTLNQSWNVELSWPGRQEAIAMWRWTRSNRRQQSGWFGFGSIVRRRVKSLPRRVKLTTSESNRRRGAWRSLPVAATVQTLHQEELGKALSCELVDLLAISLHLIGNEQ